MRLLLHLGTLRGFGSGVVGRNLLIALRDLGGDHRYVAWIPRVWGWKGDLLGDRFSLRPVRPHFVYKLLAENLDIRVAALRRRGDKLFSLGDTSLPLCPVPHLLLVQTPYLAYRPNEWGFRPSSKFRLKVALIEAAFSAALPTATLITVQTDEMKRRLTSRWDLSTDRVVVVPSAIESLERSAPPPDGRPYLCYIASAYPHKNHVVLASMMAALAARGFDLPCRVTVTREEVPDLTREAARLGILDRLEFLGPVAVPEARRLLAGAEALVMPSRLETFGLPYFEAMQLGRPVIAADLPFAREACGAAARYAQADSGEAFAEQVQAVLSSPAAARSMAQAARARFDEVHVPWTEVARRYLSILENL
jgi:glycosyltransferase involved in cell wall biosynthesis